MNIRLARGACKPPIGARVDPAHPFAKGMLITVPFNEGFSFLDVSGPGGRTVPWVHYGSVAPRTVVTNGPGSVGAAWASNRDGVAYRISNTGHQIDFGAEFIPTDAATFLVIRRKTDTTNRGSGLFGTGAAGANTLVNAHAPWSDGIHYFDWRNQSGSNEIAASGLTSQTSTPDKLIYTAGPAGTAIWFNGRKVAAQTTAVARVQNTANHFFLGQSSIATGDLIDLNFFAVYSYQWSDALCRWWSEEPYAHLYAPQATRRYVFLGQLTAPSAGGGFNALLIQP